MIYDAIVVGMGPAGATAALELSKRGFKILAIEKASLPRYKPCGGGLSAKTDKILDNGFKSVVERTIYGLCLSFQGADEIHYLSEQPICYMVMRDRFDYYLAENARDAGANILRERLIKAEEQDGKIVATTDSGRHCAQIIIGADGVGSNVARNLGLKPRSILASLMTGELRVEAAALAKAAGEIRFDFGSIPYGYGWIFPKADHLSVGVGGIGRPLKNPMPHYSRFLTRCIPDMTDSYIVNRYILPVFNGKSKISGEHCLLVGDAAALVDPFTGEGIYYAIRSAQIAAEVIADGCHDDAYEKQIADEIYSEFSYARKVGTLFYRLQGPIFKVLKQHPEFVKSFIELSRGDVSYQEFWKRTTKRLAAEPLKGIPGILKELM